jgi:ABC-2 type transport system ATP-binding protein
VALDTPAGLRGRLAHPILEVRTGDAPAALSALSATPEVLAAGLFGRALHVAVADRARGEAAVRERLGARGVAIDSLRPIPPTLEDVFVALVGASGGAAQG